jgi:uncharacterized protein YdbL (DUF1318 family)
MTRIMTRMLVRNGSTGAPGLGRAGMITMLCGGALMLLACITINVYFPEAAVKELSQQIEDEVRQRSGEPSRATGPVAPEGAVSGTGSSDQAATSDIGGRPSLLDDAGDVLSLVLSFGAREAWAQEVPGPGISNPAIRRIIDSRAARVEAVDALKGAGVVGESNRAQLEIRDLDAAGALKERAAAQRLVREENADREQLFREIAAAEDVDLSQLDRIRRTYAETIRDKARPGDWIQLPDDSWVQKQ